MKGRQPLSARPAARPRFYGWVWLPPPIIQGTPTSDVVELRRSAEGRVNVRMPLGRPGKYAVTASFVDTSGTALDSRSDAAIIGGGGKRRTPALAALGIFTVTYQWDDFFWPLIIITSEELRTLPLGLALFVVKNRTAWDLLMAGSVIATVPVKLYTSGGTPVVNATNIGTLDVDLLGGRITSVSRWGEGGRASTTRHLCLVTIASVATTSAAKCPRKAPRSVRQTTGVPVSARPTYQAY